MAHYDKSELKITALKQSLGETVANYEDKVAELRITITEQAADIDAFNQEKNALETRVAELEAQLASFENEGGTVSEDVVEGEVVQEKTSRAKKSS